MSKLLRIAVALSSVAVFGLALWVLRHALRDYELNDISLFMHHVPLPVVLLACAASLASYGVLTGFDSLAMQYVGSKLPYHRVALASFISQAISHSTGFAALTGTSIRYRLYSTVGISGGDVARIVAFCALTFGLGATVTVAGAMLFEPAAVAVAVKLPPLLISGLGWTILIGMGGYTLASLRGRKVLTLRHWQIPLPSWQMTLSQIALAVVDLAFAAIALYLLLDHSGLAHPMPGFTAFLGLYAVALLAGVISHVPGGLGVFEGLMVLMLPQVAPAKVLGALVVYRLIYNVLPLIVATLALALFEVWRKSRAVVATAHLIGDSLEAVAPALYATMGLLGGTIMLWSAATPELPERLAFIHALFPRLLIKASHLFASIVGIWLLVLARGLYRRLDGAYWLTCILYAAGIVFLMVKGIEWEEAGLLALLLLGLAPARQAFYRKASLIEQRFTVGWGAGILVIVGSALWLGDFAFRHAPFTHEMWWEFAFASHAPRGLRIAVAVMALASAWMIFRLTSPASTQTACPDEAQMAKAKALALAHPSAEAQLALMGDKSFLFDPSGQAFLMYAVSGRSWVVMGDPVGPQALWPDLIWRFREMVDRVAGWPVFYQVGAEALPYYLDLGLSFVKLGEEARVPLADFSLQGSARSELRYVKKRAEKEGASFEVLPPEQTAAVLPDLAAISDAWLNDKNSKEKRFSLGNFTADYVANFPVAVVRREGRIVAFASLWLAGDHEEVAVDLMRHGENSGYGAMDYLFTESMLWAKAQGYRWFSLGVAPLSGMRDNALAPLWNRLGALLYRHGEELYNFQGLRKYKEKFLPVWAPRFMASPGGMALPRVAADVATLISGGMKGLVMK